MKIPFGLLLLLTFSVKQSNSQNIPQPLHQKITIEVVNEPVSAILKQIGKQLQLDFSYDSRIIEGKKRVTASFKNETTPEIILKLFDDKIKCKLKGNYIILYQNNNTASRNVYNKSVMTNNIENSTVKKNFIQDSLPVFKLAKVTVDTTVHYSIHATTPDSSGKNSSIYMDSTFMFEPPLILINNDSTILLLEKDTVTTP